MIRLSTQRLLIRDHIWGDLQSHHELLSDPDVMHYLPDTMTHSLEQSRRSLQTAVGQVGLSCRRYYFFRIEQRLTGEHIGEIGYTVTQASPCGRLVNAGYFLGSAHWGLGYCTEALREVIRFAFEEGGVCRIACGCLKENAASERVMRKCRFTKEADFVEYQWHAGALRDRVEYRLLRSEWLQAP